MMKKHYRQAIHPLHWENMQNTLGYKNILGLGGTELVQD